MGDRTALARHGLCCRTTGGGYVPATGDLAARVTKFSSRSGKIRGMSWQRLGDEVRVRRKQLGLTQESLAVRAGMSVPTISAIEGNRAGRMSVRLRRALEQALQWVPGSVDAVLDGGDAQVIVAEAVEDQAGGAAGPVSKESAVQRLALAERLLGMQRAFAQHRDEMSESARAAMQKELAAALPEIEDALVWALPWLGDSERAVAIRILAQLSDVGTQE